MILLRSLLPLPLSLGVVILDFNGWRLVTWG